MPNEIPANPEMQIHAIADDFDLTLTWVAGDIVMTVKDTSGLPTCNTNGRTEITKTITPNQASAVIALFIDEFKDQELNRDIYALAEEAVGDLPHNLRPIP